MQVFGASCRTATPNPTAPCLPSDGGAGASAPRITNACLWTDRHCLRAQSLETSKGRCVGVIHAALTPRC